MSRKLQIDPATQENSYDSGFHAKRIGLLDPGHTDQPNSLIDHRRYRTISKPCQCGALGEYQPFNDPREFGSDEYPCLIALSAVI